MSIIGKTARFVAGLGLGAGLGAVTALLLAPQSGEISLAQVQSRVDAILRAGRTAAQQREDELYDAWESEIAQTGREKERAGDNDARLERERRKARDQARAHEDEARKKAQEELDKARSEAQKHLDKARAEMDRAEK